MFRNRRLKESFEKENETCSEVLIIRSDHTKISRLLSRIELILRYKIRQLGQTGIKPKDFSCHNWKKSLVIITIKLIRTI